MSPDTLGLLRRLLDQVTVQVGAPDFEPMVAALVKAKREVEEALGAASARSNGQDPGEAFLAAHSG